MKCSKRKCLSSTHIGQTDSSYDAHAGAWIQWIQQYDSKNTMTATVATAAAATVQIDSE